MDLITILFVSALGLVFLGVGWLYLKEIHDYKLAQQDQIANPKGKPAQNPMNYLDLAIWDLKNMYQELLKSGLTEDQLKPVKSRLDRLDWIKQNEGVINFAMPYADGIVKGVSKMLKG